MYTRALALALLVLAGLPAIAAAGPSLPGAGTLSPRLAELSAPGAKALSRGAQARRASLPANGPASLVRWGDRLVVEVTVDGNRQRRADALAAAGARIIDVSRSADIITAAVTVGDLERLSHVDGVVGITEALTPEYSGCPQGNEVSEGDVQLKAAAARTAGNVTGTGIKVGILSDSWDNDGSDTKDAADDVATGDIPGPTSPCTNKTAADFIDPASGGEDEGRAMGQIVHDIAPDAQLLFRQGGPTEAAFADHIHDLATAGAKVIVDDVTFFSEPMFQDGLVSKAVSDVTDQGVSYFSSAANANVIFNGQNVGSYETAAYRNLAPASCPSATQGTGTDGCMDFDPGAGTDNAFGFGVAAGDSVVLDIQWAQPQKGVTTDLDAYLVDGSGTLVADPADTATANVAAANQKPLELFSYENDTGLDQTLFLVVTRYSGTGGGNTASPRFKALFLRTGFIGAQTTTAPDVAGPTIFGHNGAEDASSVAAIDVAQTDQSKPEDYSSRGPVTLYYNPVTGTSTPATALASAKVLAKPDITASDCGVTTFFTPSSDGFRFCGTSAAAPHAAGVAALQLQRTPTLTPAEVKAAQATSATAIGSFGPEAIGAGLLNAQTAVPAAAGGGGGGGGGGPLPTPTPSPAPPALPKPVITITDGPSGPTKDSTPTFTFNATPGSVFACGFDNAARGGCSGSITHTPSAPLADGPHSFEVEASLSGVASGPATQNFIVDTKKPSLKVSGTPKKTTTSRKATFTFKPEAGSTSKCKLDKTKAKKCKSPVRYKKLKRKKHTFKLTTKDAAGNAKTFTYKWKVK